MKPGAATRGHWRTGALVAVLVATGLLRVVPAQVPVQDQQPARSALRPAVMGPSGGVSTGHPLTTAAAFGILLKGGNAFDAGVAALLAGGVLEQDLYSLGGEALVLVYPKKEAKVTSIVGQGWAPHAVDVDWYLYAPEDPAGRGARSCRRAWRAACRAHRARAVGHDELRGCGGSGDWLRGARLSHAAEHGTRHSKPAHVLRALAGEQDRTGSSPTDRFTSLARPSSCRRPPERCDAWSRLNAARKRRGRSAGIVAARDRFYKGDIAREMVAFLRKHNAPFDESDFAEYFARIEEPARTTYRGYTVYKHGFGSQGPVLLQTLNILEQFDLHAMGYASADYLHTIVEAMKLAYADRDSYYADPAFVKMPVRRAACRRLMRKNARRSSIRSARRRRLSPAIRSGSTPR